MSAQRLFLTVTHGLIFGLLVSCMGQIEKAPSTNSSKNQIQSQRSLEEIMDEIDDLSLNKTCYQNSDCKVIQFGVRPCGGPSEAVVYSTAVTSTDELEALIHEYNQVNSSLNVKNGMVGTCVAPLLPQSATCQSSQCVEE